MENAPGEGQKVWDGPTRLFHWTLVLLMLDAWLTIRFGDVRLRWHQWNGYAVAVLLLFRVCWGLWGTQSIRFAAFLRGPRAVIAYLLALRRGQHPPYGGHNPAGGWSVLAMLLLLLIQVVTGLFANDEILASGPLSYLVDKETASWLTMIHAVNIWLLLGLILLHLGAISFYWLAHKENLLAPMLHGYKEVSALPQGFANRLAPPGRAGWTLLLAGVLFWLAIWGWR
ncbi:MAG: cytochrome b/b6 domain-containing protein [Magnetococcales bacterium]|nr:cytochrome b/b6 domain-containing protein [Magnetococcales bacterium]MBF0114531.1 cytochrome b/b6 domain-containing protein [Magnetococcales bacterium]